MLPQKHSFRDPLTMHQTCGARATTLKLQEIMRLISKGLPPMRAAESRKGKKPKSKNETRENTAVDPMGYILITVNGSMGPRGACFWPFRVGGV